MAKPLKILVVDDDRDVAEGLADILSLADHDIELAFSFNTARELLASKEFDLSFINVKQSGQSGVESYFEVRRVNATARTVMTTGYTMEQVLGDIVPNNRFSLVPHSETMDSVKAGLRQASPNGLVVVCHADPNFALRLNEKLAAEGRGVATARYPEEASQIVARSPLDVLILDLRQPILSALEVYIELRDQPDCPPIVLCREATRQIGDPFRDLLTTGILFKPFDPPHLLKALGEISDHKASRNKRPTSADETPPLRILVIDDDIDLASGVEELLAEDGHTVKAATSFEKAIEVITDFDAQVALIDVQIGWNSGLDLIDQLREARPLLEPIVLTARADKDTIVAALRSGAHDYLTKPLQRDELSDALARAANRLRAILPSSGLGLSPELLANISHELRTPLNAVVGFSEILKDQMLGPLGQERYVGYATDINHAGRLITDVLGHMAGPQEKPGTNASEVPVESAEETEAAPAPTEESAPPKPAAKAPLARFRLPLPRALKVQSAPAKTDVKAHDPQGEGLPQSRRQTG